MSPFFSTSAYSKKKANQRYQFTWASSSHISCSKGTLNGYRYLSGKSQGNFFDLIVQKNKVKTFILLDMESLTTLISECDKM